MSEEVKLRVRSNDGTTMIVEQLNGEDALTYIAETPEELANLAVFPVGAEIICGLLLDMEDPMQSRVYLKHAETVLANFEFKEKA